MKICLLNNCTNPTQERRICEEHYDQLVLAGFITHGPRGGLLRESPTWKSWDNIKERCRKVSSSKYPAYGGAGIQMCDGWYSSAHEFFRSLGPRVSDTSIDRIDVNGHYSCGKCPQCLEHGWPMNCRWATTRQQNLNKKKKNKWGFPGVKKKRKYYEAYIGVGRDRDAYLGSFKTPAEAGAAYQKAREQLEHGLPITKS